MLDREMAKNTNLDKDMEEEMEGVEDSEEEDDSGRKRKMCSVVFNRHCGYSYAVQTCSMYILRLTT